MRRKGILVLLGAAIALGGAAVATGAAAHDVEVGPNGGPMIDAKGHHLELVLKGIDLTVFVTDAAHAPAAVKGASGRAVILAGKEQKTVTLEARDPNILAVKLAAPLPAGSRVVVSAKLGGGQDLLGRFVTK